MQVMVNLLRLVIPFRLQPLVLLEISGLNQIVVVLIFIIMMAIVLNGLSLAIR